MGLSVELFPHNERAYQKMIECLKKHQFVAINHATGTGKSFILLKYMYENRNKRILFLSPTYPIIDQLLNDHMKDLEIDKKSFVCLDTNIYRNLLNKNMEDIAKQYDIIILDEYHRCGSLKWGKKVNELLNILKSHYPDKKVIGTTATEIRYLDNMKNMNEILFDGVTASTLTLADAILEGILPIFDYVNPAINLLVELEDIKKRFKKYFIYDPLFQKYGIKIDRIISLIEDKIRNDQSLRDYLPEKGKFLVFSSTIEKIKENKKLISEIFKNKRYKEYIISYDQGKKKNADILNSFKQDVKDDNPILYSINILNEGLHVKDIDAIFMLRETSSPIIYFQQLGRLLSYSRRKEKVIVFDLVNNISRNKEIYYLYKEIHDRAVQLIKDDPSNKERYQKILDEFKIIDNAEIYLLLGELHKLSSTSNLINLRINGAIEILSNNNSEYAIYRNQAIIDLFHYEKYITLEQFYKIKSLQCEKPSIFRLTEMEFQELLKGHKNIKELTSNYGMEYYKKAVDFYNINYRFPSVFSEDDDERELAQHFLKRFMTYLDSKQHKITNLSDKELPLIERISYGEQVKVTNVDELYNQINYFIDHQIYINDNVISFFKNINDSKSSQMLNKIFEYSNLYLSEEYKMINGWNAINSSYNRQALNRKFDGMSEYLFREEFSDNAHKLYVEYSQSTDKKQYIYDVYKELELFIRKNMKMPTVNEPLLMCKKIIFKDQLKFYQYDTLLNKILEEVQEKQLIERKNAIKKDIIEYISKHDGCLPVLNISEEDEELNKKYQEIKKYFTEEDKKHLQLEFDKYKNHRIYIVNQYVRFIKQKRRKPRLNSNNDYEKNIAIEYERIKEILNDTEQLIIKECIDSLNKYEQSKQIYLDMIANKNGGKKR